VAAVESAGRKPRPLEKDSLSRPESLPAIRRGIASQFKQKKAQSPSNLIEAAQAGRTFSGSGRSHQNVPIRFARGARFRRLPFEYVSQF
jgi:hypothetical protein